MASATALAEALAEAAIIKRYFGTRAVAAAVANGTPRTTTTAPKPASSEVTTRNFSSSASPARSPPLPEAVRFLNMFGRKQTNNRVMDPLIVAAFSSAGDR